MNMLTKSSNAVFSLRYHLIIVVKYRKQIFSNDQIISDLKLITSEISANHDIQILSQECGTDHLHILFEAKPTTDIVKYINVLKGNTSRRLRSKYHQQLKQLLYGAAMWSPSYYLTTAGNVSLETLMTYIQNQ